MLENTFKLKMALEKKRNRNIATENNFYGLISAQFAVIIILDRDLSVILWIKNMVFIP